MNDPRKDSLLASTASSMIIHGRYSEREVAAVMVTLEHTVATVLLTLYPNPAKAAAMLNEGLLQGVEERLAMVAAQRAGK